jgi:small-conductance mechanosensitive channel
MSLSSLPVFAWMDVFTAELAADFIRGCLILFIGFPLLYIATRVPRRLLTKHLSAHSGMILSKAMFYIGTVVLVLTVLREFGFQLTALLGAAGIMGVAIGFASQTSVSNIISGIFLLWEKPFQVGDSIKVGDIVGLVFSIDLMSTSLRTFDNRLVRIPNEQLIKSQVINITRFPIRRHDINVGVSYKEDVAKVIRVLKEVADKNPYCLDEPEPVIIFTEFGDSSLNFLFGVWFAKADFLVLRNSIMREIKERFDAEGIEIPFPHRTLYTGAITEPFPIKIITGTGLPGEGGGARGLPAFPPPGARAPAGRCRSSALAAPPTSPR